MANPRDIAGERRRRRRRKHQQQQQKEERNGVLWMNRDAHWLRPWPFRFWVVAPQNHGEPIRDEIFPDLQMDITQTDQAYCRWLALFSTHGKVRRTLEICYLARVYRVRALGKVVCRCGKEFYRCSNVVYWCGKVVYRCGSVVYRCSNVVFECGSGLLM